jgi:hypothetical protein
MSTPTVPLTDKWRRTEAFTGAVQYANETYWQWVLRPVFGRWYVYRQNGYVLDLQTAVGSQDEAVVYVEQNAL